MKIKLKIEKEFDVKFLAVTAGIRYAEDVEIDGKMCNLLTQIPWNDGKYWQIMINVNTGMIENWPIGKTAKMCAKVCDDGTYAILDANKEVIKEYEGYVPDCLAIGDSGYGDYLILKIDENGKIKNWKPKFDEWQNDEDD